MAFKTRNAPFCAALCLVLAGGCSPPSDVTGDLRPPATGKLTVTVTGLPSGAAGAVSITSPLGYSRTITATETLHGLNPGSYTITATDVAGGPDRYGVAPVSQHVVVAAGITPAQAVVAYVAVTGRLFVSVDSVPEGGRAEVVVTGANGFSRTLSDSATLTGLLPGTYAIAATRLDVGGDLFDPEPPAQTVQVAAGTIPVTAAPVRFSRSSGRIALTVTGLPGGTLASVQVLGPNGYTRLVTASATLSSLAPGSYQITAAPVTGSGNGYLPDPASTTVSVTASSKPVEVSVVYTLSTGSLEVSVSGLPSGVPAQITVSGPQGYQSQHQGGALLMGLVPGLYVIGAAAVTMGDASYAPTPVSQTVSVSAGAGANATVTYAATPGNLTIAISGLPGGVGAGVQVTGPGGFSQSLAASATLSGLTPGSYAIAASVVSSGGTTYTPSPASQNRSVTAGQTVQAAVAYSGSGGGATLNLRVDGWYLTQATQAYDGSVPLVAGRDAYLRGFVIANQSNTSQPTLRVRLYNGATLQQTYTITAPSASVPTAVAEATLASSWNILVPGTLIQPGLRVLADVDPAGAIAESDEADNLFPVSGTPALVDVRSLPVFQMRFVPVLQQVNNLQGNVSDANKEAFLANVKAMLPVGAYHADVRAVYTTTAPALQSGNGNNAWSTILSEVLALKNADASTRYYYGVVKTGYGSGVVGMGYVGGGARTSIGWDVMSNAPHTMAHEVGHNMGRSHAPCGGPGNPDPGYPYANGAIGVHGLDVASLTAKPPSVADLMSYCHPAWISDYNWKAMIQYREGGPSNAPAAVMAASSGLLVWGRITAAGVVLEPSFRVAATGMLPEAGPHRLELLGDDGRVFRSIAFQSAEVADLPAGAERHFAFVLPLDAAADRALTGLRVASAGGTVTRLSPALVPAPDNPDLVRVNPEQVELRWDPSRHPMVLVRDAVTGQVLSFARGGTARLWARGGAFQLIYSDGVNSVSRSARVLR